MAFYPQATRDRTPQVSWCDTSECSLSLTFWPRLALGYHSRIFKQKSSSNFLVQQTKRKHRTFPKLPEEDRIAHIYGIPGWDSI